MAVTSISIVCTVWVLKLHHCCPHQRPVPTWLRCIVPRRASDRPPPVLGHTTTDGTEPVAWPRTSRTPTAGAGELLQLVGRLSTAAEQSVDAGQSATSSADCSAHGDRRRSGSASCEYRDLHSADINHPSVPSTAAGRPVGDREQITRRLAAMEEMVDQLATLLTRKDDEDKDGQVAADWRRVAAFADRCLFWIFVVITVIYTVTTMIVVPLYLQWPLHSCTTMHHVARK